MPDQFLPKPRVPWIDTAKGVGIILVVVAHVCVGAAGGYLSWFLFLFHMPFFFIVAGILTKAEPPYRLLGKRARSLLVPYAAFLILLGGLLVAKDAFSGGGLLENDLWSLAYGGDRLGGYLGVFWFVTCMFAAQQSFNVLLTVSPRAFGLATLSALLACLAAATVLSGHPGPLAIGVVPFAVAMLWVGYAYRPLDGRNGLVTAAAVVAAVTLLGATRFMGFHLDMKHADYGPPLAGALLAVALSVLLLALCKGLDRIAVLGPLLRRAGQASLLIMFLHQPVHFAIGKVVSAEPLIAAIALAVPMLAFELVSRSRLLSPILLGVPRPGLAPRRNEGLVGFG